MIYWQVEVSDGALVSRIGPAPGIIARALARHLAKLYGRTMYLRDMTANEIVYGVMV